MNSLLKYDQLIEVHGFSSTDFWLDPDKLKGYCLAVVLPLMVFYVGSAIQSGDRFLLHGEPMAQMN